MPIVTRTGNSVNVNLTIPFLIWSAFWLALALVFSTWSLVWVAALPWLFMLGFIVLAFGVSLIAMFAAYRRGVPITLTMPRKGTRVVRRSR